MRTLEEKKLLVNAVCEYAPYGPLIANEDIDSGFPTRIHPGHLGLSRFIEGYGLDSEIYGEYKADKTVIYLRPMDSMTEKERKEFSKLLVKRYCEEDWEGHISTSYCIEIDNVYTDDEDGIKYPSAFSMDAIDWLRAHLFDYRGLIEKGIAKPIGTERKWLSTETLKKTTEIIENTIKETKKIIEDGQKKNRRVKR